MSVKCEQAIEVSVHPPDFLQGKDQRTGDFANKWLRSNFCRFFPSMALRLVLLVGDRNQ